MKVLWRFKGYPLRYKRHLAAAYFFMSVGITAGIFVPRLVGMAIDDLLATGPRSEQLLLAVGIVLLGLSAGALEFARTYLVASISANSTADLMNDFVEKLLSLSPGYYDRQRTGDLMSRGIRDAWRVQRFVAGGLSIVVTMAATFAVVAAVMFLTDWRLASILMGILAVYIWIGLQQPRNLKKAWAQVQAETGEMTATLQENLIGMRVVKAFAAGKYQGAKLDGQASTVADLTYSARQFFAVRKTLFIFIYGTALGVILWFGGREVIEGRLTSGELVAFILYMGILEWPLRLGIHRVSEIPDVVTAGHRVLQVLEADSPVKERPGAEVMPQVRGHVRFEGVSVQYGNAADAVRDIDFEIQPGQMVAILGASGSGKSTIVHLIPRFYDASDGRVTIDGVDVRDATLPSLRKNIGIALQDVFAFSGTFTENIAYGAGDVSFDDVVQAAKVAHLHEFIESLPDRYDTLVGERGIRLSGGQRQRLAIARTILLDPPILILDDSTSSVDVGTEYQIQQALADVVKGRTTFVIAQRLSTIRKADLILVLDQGEIVERGTHSQLLAEGGYYSRIYDQQLRPTIEDALGLDPGGDSVSQGP